MDTSTLNDLLDFELGGSPPIDGVEYPEAFSSSHPPPAVYNQSTGAVSPAANAWDPRMVLDLAIGVDGLEEILDRYGLSMEAFELLSNVPTFRRDLAMTMRDVRENGVPFAAKAKVLAESYLTDIDEMIQDEKTPASTRLNAIQSVVRWGRLEPTKDASGESNTNANQINISINF